MYMYMGDKIDGKGRQNDGAEARCGRAEARCGRAQARCGKEQGLFLRITIACLAACAVLFCIESFLKPAYFVKAAIKIGLFGTAIVIGLLPERLESLREQFAKLKKVMGGRILLLAAGVYAFIVAGYFALRGFIDSDVISASLSEKGGISGDNFILVAAYISLVNSFLEEVFFRGTLFFAAKKYNSTKAAYVVSAVAFSLYHVAIIDGWFELWMYGLMLLGLFAVGIFFNWLCERSESFAAPWLVHGFANLAINTVGLVVLGMV